MMTAMTSDKVMPQTRDLCLFLSDYSGWLLGCGATCIRLEKNVQRIAASFGKRVEITINPRHVHISILGSDEAEIYTTIAPVRHTATSFNLISDLSTLSWHIADGKIGLEDAREALRRLVSSDTQSPIVVLLLVSFANASFCRLFGGDAIAMLIVAVATLVGFWLKQRLLVYKVDIRVVMLVCSFVSSVIGATDYFFAVGTTPAVTVGTSILYLVPGVPYLNSFSDFLYRYYICSFSRFMDALTLTACLSVGLCAGMMLMNVGMF